MTKWLGAFAAIAVTVMLACCQGVYQKNEKCATWVYNPQTGEVTITECETTETYYMPPAGSWTASTSTTIDWS